MKESEREKIDTQRKKERHTEISREREEEKQQDPLSRLRSKMFEKKLGGDSKDGGNKGDAYEVWCESGPYRVADG